MNTNFSTSTFTSVSTGRRSFNVVSPTWITSQGQLANIFTTKSYSISLEASNAFLYGLSSGSLPPGLSLNSDTGEISGTFTSGAVADYTANVTYNFSVRAVGVSGSSIRDFSINGNSIFVGATCATADENGTAAATVPSGYVIKRIDFLSYGTPNGSCGSFTYGGCHTGSLSNLNDRLGTNSFSRPATNEYWGDPCGGPPKRLYIQVSHGPA